MYSRLGSFICVVKCGVLLRVFLVYFCSHFKAGIKWESQSRNEGTNGHFPDGVKFTPWIRKRLGKRNGS